MPASAAVTFGWTESPNAAFHRIEITRADGEPVHTAIVARGLGTYRAPPWLAERSGERPLRWRVVAIDARDRELDASEWRVLRVGTK